MMSKEVSDCGNIALRTIPVYLKSGNRKLKVNALLDDASTKTYVNADIATELGLQGHPQRVNVSVLNRQVETFETTPIDCFVESLDGKSYRITAFTTSRVTGNMNTKQKHLGCKKVRGQSEATLPTGMCDQKL